METNQLHKSVLQNYEIVDEKSVDEKLNEEMQLLDKKIIVLDDDPTGVQTVHDIPVFTDWSLESIRNGFMGKSSMFFILTNSRSFTEHETIKAHKEIASNILKISKETKKDYILISRGDSTLRGHYPLETEVLKETIESSSDKKFDGEIILPFFKEGGRYTINNVHYVQNGELLIPAGETEFAKDSTFGYTNSNLGDWIEEKSKGKYKAADTTYVSLESLRKLEIDKISKELLNVNDFNKVVVNAIDYVDVKIFTIALIMAINSGKNFLYRTAAAFTKVIGGVSDKELLTKKELIKEDTSVGGLIIVGSHVEKTTQQLKELKKLKGIEFIEINCHLVTEPLKFEKEIDNIVKRCEKLIKEGKTVTVYTTREKLDFGNCSKEEKLKMSVKISDGITNIVTKLTVRPKYIIAKGGITSSDIGTKGLSVKKAIVAGQIAPGIPVWITGEESKFPGIAYIIFPGNVGKKETLREVVQKLS